MRKPNKAHERERVAKLTPKESLFSKAFATSLNGTKSALASYDTKDPKTASVIASENLAKPRVQQAIQEALREVGYNETFISSRLKAITEAGTSEKALKQASVKDATRSLELGARLYGLLGNTNTNNTLVIKAELSNKTTNELREEIKALREQEERFLG